MSQYWQRIVTVRNRIGDVQERIISRQLALLQTAGLTDSGINLRVRLWEFYVMKREYHLAYHGVDFDLIPGMRELQDQYDLAANFLLRFMRNNTK